MRKHKVSSVISDSEMTSRKFLRKKLKFSSVVGWMNVIENKPHFLVSDFYSKIICVVSFSSRKKYPRQWRMNENLQKYYRLLFRKKSKAKTKTSKWTVKRQKVDNNFCGVIFYFFWWVTTVWSKWRSLDFFCFSCLLLNI